MIIYAVLFLCLAVCALLCMEAIWRGSFSEAVMWATRQPQVAAMHIAAIAAMEAMLFALMGRMALSVGLVNGVLMLAALIQHYKLELRGENFLLGDVMMVKEAAMIISRFTITFPWYVIIPCALLCFMPFCMLGMRLRGYRLRRAAAFVASALLFVLAGAGVFGISDSTTMERDYYNLNGLISGLVWSRPRALEKPENYSEAQIEAILAGCEQEDAAQVLPDILFVMSESLYDLARVDQASLSGDVMPYFRRLQAQHWGGEICVIPAGGGTVHTEYSVLTGYLPTEKSVAPYLNQSMARDGAYSVPRLLGEYGYHTMAMHPNVGSMYNRSRAYQYLGFDEMVFIDDMPEVYDSVGTYPSDQYLFEEIIRRYEDRPADQPWFSFVVTYQNHGAYDYPYDRRDILVRDAAGNVMNEPTTYVNAIKASDEALEMLVSYIGEQERPMMLVLFGDHAPALGSMGLEVGDTLEDEYLMHTTPVVVYSNYGFEMPAESGSVMSSYRLGASVLHALGLRGDRYFNYLAAPEREDLYKLSDVVVRQGGFAEEPQRYAAASEELALLYYDRVDGNQYSRKEGADE